MVVAALGVVLLRSLRRGMEGIKKASGVGRLAEPKNSSASTQGLVNGMVLSEVRWGGG